ncbi:MAG: DUF169 domain-containing protein [Methanomicrobiales archaeon]|nr:DUF169 domain-containing protein [Methanomicrobiales archaeon]
MTLTIPQIGARLAEAGRLTSRPLCIAGSDTIPKGAVPAPSIDRCVAKAIATVAFNTLTPPIYLGPGALEGCCPSGIAYTGFGEQSRDSRFFISSGSPGVAGGNALYLKANPDLVDASRLAVGEIRPIWEYLVVRPAENYPADAPEPRSILLFAHAEPARVLCALAHFGSADVFGTVLTPWGAACASFITYPAGLAERAPKNAVFLGPTDASVNLWFPREVISLGIPMEIARKMTEDVPASFIGKRPGMAYPERRVYLK